MSTAVLPRAFIWRRLHSLTGLWVVLFLMEHLFVNSQAALWLGDEWHGFVQAVNSIHNLPYLHVIEVVLLGVPIAFHAALGVRALLRAKSNAHSTDGSAPSLPEYGRNRAYSWQRITSWILLIGIVAHVVKFRFIEYPERVVRGTEVTYLVTVDDDPGLAKVADRLGVSLHESSSENKMICTAHDFGTATLLTVREAFRQPIYVVLYTIFVLAACFHAFNGFWTFLITWGVILKMSAQRAMANVAIGLMVLVALLGLLSIWGTYLLNL
jgi:succinate dehydrogenase / fumarate reductase cytochrome b subunit